MRCASACLLWTAVVVTAQFDDDTLDEALNSYYADTLSDIRSQGTGELSVSSWPPAGAEMSGEVGEVGGVAVDSVGNLHVFHRGQRQWKIDSFDDENVFQEQSEPIKEHTLLTVDADTGDVVDKRGADTFYMPHGLFIDHEDNVWVTDVAMHQVFKFAPGEDKPSLVLGEKFVPGDDAEHFCKPTDVAVASNGDFFVADGYCNGRVMKFSADGTLLATFGKAAKSEQFPPPAGEFRIPHSLALVEDWNMICVADRENERIQCFTAGLETTAAANKAHQLPIGMLLKSADNLGRVFAIRARKHVLYGVINTGLAAGENQLFAVNLRTGDAETLAPGLANPHSLAIGLDGSMFVGEIGPDRILKIE